MKTTKQGIEKLHSLNVDLFVFYHTQLKAFFSLPTVREYYLYATKVKDSL